MHTTTEHATNEQMKQVLARIIVKDGRQKFPGMAWDEQETIRRYIPDTFNPVADLAQAFSIIEVLRTHGWHGNVEITKQMYIVSLGRLAHLHTVAVAKTCRTLDQLPQTMCNAIQDAMMESAAYGI